MASKKITIKQLLPGVRKNVGLKDYSTFRVGGKARYFFVARSKCDLQKAGAAAQKMKLPFFVIGNGSNILFPDKGIAGLVIKIQNSDLTIKNYDSLFEIYCGAGLLLANLVAESVKIGAAGLEWAAGIPATVGGAVWGNAGAFKQSIGDSVTEVEYLDLRDLRIKKIEGKKCRFAYRESIFKKRKNWIIVSVLLKLKKGNKEEIINRVNENLNHRKENQPIFLPSAGSVFKNPAPEQSSVRGKSKNFSAGALIEKCGLKGKKIGKAMISEKHSNFIVNLGGAKASDVKKLINLAKKKVEKKFKIKLQEEIQIIK